MKVFLSPPMNKVLENINPKYFNLILHILETANDINLGTKKLFKLLYFIDFDYYEKHEKPITGTQYIVEQYGPIPKDGYEVLGAMTKAKLIKPLGAHIGIYNYKRFIPLTKADLKAFNGEEKDHIDAVIKRFADYNGAQIEAVAKNDIPFRVTKESGEESVDYELVFYRNPSPEVFENEKEDKIILNSESLQSYLEQLSRA